MTKKATWEDIYTNMIESYGGCERFIKEKAKEKRALIRRIRKHAGKRGTVMEAGCGSGATSCYLSLKGYRVTSIDNDTRMVEFAEWLATHTGADACFKEEDIREPSFVKNSFDVVFSNGVLEHFPDKKIITILNKEVNIGRTVIFAVPSAVLEEKDKLHGDERFLPSTHWEALIDRSEGDIVDRFAYGFKKKEDALLYYMNRRAHMDKATFIGFVVR